MPRADYCFDQGASTKAASTRCAFVDEQGMIFDPFTGSMDGTGRSVFSSNGRLNVIPTSRLNPAMMKLLALVPHSNLPGDVTNFYNSGTQRLNRNNLDVGACFF